MNYVKSAVKPALLVIFIATLLFFGIRGLKKFSKTPAIACQELRADLCATLTICGIFDSEPQCQRIMEIDDFCQLDTGSTTENIEKCHQDVKQMTCNSFLPVSCYKVE